ncbi:APC family permease [Paracidobacterium acidisoli]|uniref:Amino acid permease n=1 Tax=Paracidobacterium acidisoli TaxID=2303751 RepID=A0A372IUP8_9BACT|nr:amino acid permease [Paracidobacterium acidisoli]MBT9330137.1 amino acid permease [Paracidobacterium acidisoli]
MTDKTISQRLDQDSAQLQALGYSSNFERTMTVWENFSLGFTYLSPVVGVYSVFALAVTSGGPPMFWNYILVGLGQLLVCLIFGEIVSQFPISGGIYPWSRRLVGKRWAWMAGWVYLWALCTTIAAVAVGGAPYLAALAGIRSTHSGDIFIALAMVCVTTLLNVSGTRLLARVAMIGFVCELAGAIVVGSYLLLFARHQHFAILFQTFHVEGSGSYFYAFVASSVAAMFCYYGFEACGDVAEETPNPGVAIPKAMRMTIYIGGAAAIFVTLALLLAITDMPSVISGKDADPVVTVLRNALGPLGVRIVMAIVLISFFSCLLSLQAATSRLLFSYGRDGMIVGSRYLNKLSERTRMPIAALIIAGLIPAIIVMIGFFLENAVRTIIVFGSAGIYVAFQMVVLGALIARSKGWKPTGRFRLNGWGWPVNIAALAYGIAAIINMMWPRSPSDPWYLNYGMIMTSVIVLACGAVYMILLRPYEKGTAPAGDAHRIAAQLAGAEVSSGVESGS